MTVGSLFSGIGGLELGFEWAGFTVKWQVECEPFCRAVLAKHWPDVPRYDDVREVGAHNLEPVDVLVGGFPCQDVSDAGQRVGIDGARSGLWAEYARIVRELRPRYVVVENVRGLFVRGMDRVLGDLAAIGYDAEWTRLRASDVGAPHRRERVFLVAYTDEWRRSLDRTAHDDDRRDASRHDFDGCGAPVDDAAEPRLEGHQSGAGDEGHLQRGPAGSTRWPARPGEPQHAWEPPRILRRAQSGVGVHADGLSRGLVRHRRRALAALGNAVVPQCAYLVALRVRQLAEEAA